MKLKDKKKPSGWLERAIINLVKVKLQEKILAWEKAKTKKV
jgi:hypothetical protein